MTISHKTECDMSGWSEDVEKEREELLHAVSLVYNVAMVTISVSQTHLVLLVPYR